MMKNFTVQDGVKAMRCMPSPRARIAFLLAMQTGLKYSQILRLKYEDVYFPNGVAVDVLAVRPRRATKRHPYCRYNLSHAVRVALHTYCVAHGITVEGAFLFARRITRNVPVSARHLLRDIKAGLSAIGGEESFEPTCAQKMYKARLKAALEGNTYLYRVGCGLRLPKDGPDWKANQEPLLFGAQARIVEAFETSELWMFWAGTQNAKGGRLS